MKSDSAHSMRMASHNARVEAVARAFCIHDNGDPEEIVELTGELFPGGGYTSQGSGLARICHGPKWQLYWKRAEPFVIADMALSPSEPTVTRPSE